MNETGKLLVVIFPACENAAEFGQPCEQALNLLSPLVPAQYATVLEGSAEWQLLAEDSMDESKHEAKQGDE